MSTAPRNPPATIEDYTRQIVNADPKTALEIALAATEKVRLESERASAEARELAEVTMGPDGMQTTTLGGLYRAGTMYSRSMLIPADYRQKPDDCAIIVQLAQRLGADPFMVFQHVHVIHGKPGMDAQLSIALINRSGKIIGTIQYQFSGEKDGFGCTASVIDAETKAEVFGPKVDWKMVKAEGWDKPKKNKTTGATIPSKWTTMSALMFHYRAASYLIRTRYPDVTMGMLTADELEDIGPDTVPTDAQAPADSLDELTDRMEQAAKQPEPAGNGETATAEPEKPTEPEPEETSQPEAKPELNFGGAEWSDDEIRTIDECDLALSGVDLDQGADLIAGKYDAMVLKYKGMRVERKISAALLDRLLADVTRRRQRVLGPPSQKKRGRAKSKAATS